MGELRTNETMGKYVRFRKNGGLEDGCRLCEAPIVKDFKYWKIMKNKFPYDLIAEVHDMILPKRHVDEDRINSEEWQEYKKIKDEYLHENYGYIVEATHRKKSIPEHFHLHLIVAKE